MRELELYVHIPFCMQKCRYCDFLSGPADRETQRRYVDALKREILAADGRGRQVTSIFFGGGTPSLLPGEWTAELLEIIRERFCVSPDAEITTEANPGTVDAKKLALWKRSGINRISFGCQSSFDAELRMLGRIHTWEDFLESFAAARDCGFENISVDLMSGLPDQTLSMWETTLLRTAGLRPEHISAYSLIVEEGTPFASMELNLPDEDTERSMYSRTARLLGGFGYSRYEISNYALAGRECRHNTGYWLRADYLGFGVGAASLVDGVRFSNLTELDGYLRFCGTPGALRRGVERLQRKDEIEETMFLGLRMTRGVDKRRFEETFQTSIRALYGPVLDKFKGLELLEENEEAVFLTEEGISVSNAVMAEFLL